MMTSSRGEGFTWLAGRAGSHSLLCFTCCTINFSDMIDNFGAILIPSVLCFQMYKHSNNKIMSSGAIAAMLSTILYSRRFFPYYVYNIIGGLDEEGTFPFVRPV